MLWGSQGLVLAGHQEVLVAGEARALLHLLRPWGGVWGLGFGV